MGTPVPIREREEQCRGAGPCSDPRPMTEEEILKYCTKEEIEEMKGPRITPPEREKLLEVITEVRGKTRSIHHAAKKFGVSFQTVYNWIKKYGIEFDADGKAFVDATEQHKVEAEVKEELQEVNKDDIIPVDCQAQNATSTAEVNPESKEKQKLIEVDIKASRMKYKVGYAEYDICNVLVKVDFRQGLVIINNSKEMTFDETEAVIDLLSEIL